VPFTAKEDEQLRKLVATYPNHWKAIEKHFKNKTANQLKERWLALQGEESSVSPLKLTCSKVSSTTKNSGSPIAAVPKRRKDSAELEDVSQEAEQLDKVDNVLFMEVNRMEQYRRHSMKQMAAAAVAVEDEQPY